jgi:hypothetical protein
MILVLMIPILFLQGLSLPLKGVCKPLDSNVVAASGSLKPQISHANDPKMSNKTENMSPLMYVINSSHAYCYVLFHIYEKSHMDCMYASYLAPI